MVRNYQTTFCYGQIGDDGFDKLAGAGGNDLIFSNFPVNPTGPDGSKDIVDCGPGDNYETF